jgi:hypothetical protein
VVERGMRTATDDEDSHTVIDVTGRLTTANGT